MEGVRHGLLRGQISRYLGEPDSIPDGWRELLESVDATYEAFDRDRAGLQATLDQSSKDLLQAGADMRAVFQAFPDLFLWVDPDDTIANVHAGSSEDPDLQREMLLGKRLQDVAGDDVARQFEEALSEVRSTGCVASVEYELEQRDSFYEARIVPLISDQVLVIVRDITARKQAERLVARQNEVLEEAVRERTGRLREAMLAAEAASEAKSAFLANMSHELRTPLHAILSFASFGTKKLGAGSSDKVEGYLEKIDKSGRTLLALVNDLLDLAKLENGMVQLQLALGDLVEVVDSVTEELQSLLGPRDLTLVWDKPDHEATAVMDAERLKQVVRNLLGNAITYSPEGGTIEITLEQVDTNFVVAVKDEGVGIPENELATVFEKFVQSSATSTSAGGTGLGLAICREVVLGHAGRIWAEAREPRGAVLSFEVPAGIAAMRASVS